MAESKRRRAKWGELPLRIKLVVVFTIAMAVIVAALWLIYALAAKPLYGALRLDYAKNAADALAENVDSDVMETLAKELSSSENLCIRIVDSEGNGICSVEVHGGRNCMLHAASEGEMKAYLATTRENGGSFDERSVVSEEGTELPDLDFSGDVPELASESVTHMVFRTVRSADYGEVLIGVETVLTAPVTVKYTFLIVVVTLTVGFLALGIVGSFMLGKAIAEPIQKLAGTAVDIARGENSPDFSAHGYKEVNELKESLAVAAKEVGETEHFRRELLANVSHDLRTPLTLIKGYAELMRDIPSEAKEENFNVIVDEATRLTGLVTDMLDLSRTEEGGDKMRLDIFDIVKTLSALIGRHGKLIEHLGYKLEFEHEERALVYADEQRIVQVVYNLINNAVNYAGDDKLVIIKQYTRAGNVRIEVTDHGEGVDVGILPHIWDRYFKSNKSHRRATVGTGLGLSIVKSVMERHPGGVYGVISEKGKGSTFYIELPKYRRKP